MNPILLAGATAAVVSKRGRQYLRQGVVYGLAGALSAGDAVVSAARGVTHTAEHAASGAGGTVASAAREAKHGAEGLAGGLLKEAKALREHPHEQEPPAADKTKGKAKTE